MPPKTRSTGPVPTPARQINTRSKQKPKAPATPQAPPQAPVQAPPQAPAGLRRARVATAFTPWKPSSGVPPTWEQYSKLSEKQKEKVKAGWVPDPPPVQLKRGQRFAGVSKSPAVPVMRDGCCRTGEMIINDFSDYGGVPFEQFLKANQNRGKGRTFIYAYESQADRLNRKARGGTEPVLKFGRSNELGRLWEYYNRHGTTEEGDFSGAFLLGLQDVGPRRPDDVQGPKRSHVVEAALHRLAKQRVPESKRRKRGWETHFFNTMADAEQVFNDPSLKEIKVNNAPARRSDRARKTRECLQYAWMDQKDNSVEMIPGGYLGLDLPHRREAASVTSLLNPQHDRWF
jgi:hypothetical protein